MATIKSPALKGPFKTGFRACAPVVRDRVDSPRLIPHVTFVPFRAVMSEPFSHGHEPKP
jgi:hypothetical protein